MEILQKVIKVLINTLMTIILVIGILFIILYIIGIEPFVVESGSMQPTIETGSVSFINKKINYSDIRVNDVIAFKASTGNLVTHRVINITDEGFETQGDSNDVSDGISTTQKNYIGKNIFSIPKIGYFVAIMQTTRGKIILGTVIVVILLSGFLLGEDKKGKRSADDKPKKNTDEEPKADEIEETKDIYNAEQKKNDIEDTKDINNEER